MSYSDPPDPDEFGPRWMHDGANRARRLHKERPALFYLFIWILCAVTALLDLWSSATYGSRYGTAIGGWLGTAIALFGWIVPFVIFVRSRMENRTADET